MSSVSQCFDGIPQANMQALSGALQRLSCFHASEKGGGGLYVGYWAYKGYIGIMEKKMQTTIMGDMGSMSG